MSAKATVAAALGASALVAGSVLGIQALTQAQAAPALLHTSVPAPVHTPPPPPLHTYYGMVTMGPQAMEGNVKKVVNGDVLKAGYDFKRPGNNDQAATVTFYFPPGPPDAFDFKYTCSSGTASGNIYVEPPNQVYSVPGHDSSDWFPSKDQSSPSVYQGKTTLATTCTPPKTINLSKGGTFTACVTLQTVDTNPDQLLVRWHYSVLGSDGDWSDATPVKLSTTHYANGC